ncbi:MAG: SRPBCC family protein [Solirubrobacterales bacterium]
MIKLTTAHTISSAPPAEFFARWADMESWPEWNTDTEWVRLDGPFKSGSTGQLKPKGGPKVNFVIERLSASEFVDVSKLIGARLTFDHRIEQTPAGGSDVSVAVTLDGPLARVWNVILGKDIKSSVQPDLDRLVAVAEA